MKAGNGLMVLIILLLIGNLCGTMLLFSKTASIELKSFDKENSIDIVKKEFDRCIAIYNSGKQQALWDMFGNNTVSPMQKEISVKSIIKIRNQFGAIKDGSYMYQEYSGKRNNWTSYNAYFRVNSANPEVSRKGTLMLTFATDGNINELKEFSLMSK